MSKQILILILIFSMLFSGCSNLVYKTENSKFKEYMLHQNLFGYNGQIDYVCNVSQRRFKDNKKWFKLFSFIHANITNTSQVQENTDAVGILDFKKVIRKIIRKHFLKHIDRKRDIQHRKRNLLI